MIETGIKQNNTQNYGFTLIEMMIMIALIAIPAAVVTPNLKNQIMD